MAVESSARPPSDRIKKQGSRCEKRTGRPELEGDRQDLREISSDGTGNQSGEGRRRNHAKIKDTLWRFSRTKAQLDGERCGIWSVGPPPGSIEEAEICTLIEKCLACASRYIGEKKAKKRADVAAQNIGRRYFYALADLTDRWGSGPVIWAFEGKDLWPLAR